MANRVDTDQTAPEQSVLGPRCLLLYLIRQFCLFDLILYVPSTVFQLNRDGSSWVEPVLS